MTSRRCFEEAFAVDHGETVEALGRRGWYSYHTGRDWAAICAADDLPAEERGRILAGCQALARFGDTPPILPGNGAGGAAC